MTKYPQILPKQIIITQLGDDDLEDLGIIDDEIILEWGNLRMSVYWHDKDKKFWLEPLTSFCTEEEYYFDTIEEVILTLQERIANNINENVIFKS